MRLYDPQTGSWYSADNGTLTPSESTTPASTPNTVSMYGYNASGLATTLLAAQMADWEQTYKPVELNLLSQSSLNNPEVLTNAVEKAGTVANQSYDAMAGVRQRQMMAQGISATPQQEAVSSRLSNLSRGAAVAGGENRARQQVSTQDQLIALGTAPNPNVVSQSMNSKYSGS